MKLACRFTLNNEILPKMVEFAKNSTPEYWFEILKGARTINLEKANPQTKNAILVILIALGLLKMEFNETEVLTILENLLEIDKKSLSPGNSRIH